MKDVLRFVLMRHGVLSVMTPGTHWMPMLHVDSWDTLDLVNT